MVSIYVMTVVWRVMYLCCSVL